MRSLLNKDFSLKKKVVHFYRKMECRRCVKRTYENISKLWDCFEVPSEKKIRYNPPDATETFVIRVLALKYAVLSLAVDCEEGPEKFLYAGLFKNITNTIFSIMRLAENGLDYQAMSLIRNLFELYMILIVTTSSTEKRKEFIAAHEPEDSRVVWHRYFTKTKFLKAMKEYCTGREDLEKAADIFQTWIDDNYSELSSFVHNDYVNIVCGSLSQNDLNGYSHPNIWGEYVTWRKRIYNQLFIVAWPSDLIFSYMLRDPSVEMSLEEILSREVKTHIKEALDKLETLALDIGMPHINGLA